MKVELENVKPMDIEKRSFEIITEELGDKKLVPGTELIVKRCIHTSADFDYAENLCFSENAVEKAIAAIKDGACIVTDTHMAESGINKRVLSRYGGEVFCFISDEDVAATAKANGTTRATASMDKAAAMGKKLIFAIGNVSGQYYSGDCNDRKSLTNLVLENIFTHIFSPFLLFSYIMRNFK